VQVFVGRGCGDGGGGSSGRGGGSTVRARSTASFAGFGWPYSLLGPLCGSQSNPVTSTSPYITLSTHNTDQELGILTFPLDHLTLLPSPPPSPQTDWSIASPPPYLGHIQPSFRRKNSPKYPFQGVPLPSIIRRRSSVVRTVESRTTTHSSLANMV